jgi:hypothetical protein
MLKTSINRKRKSDKKHKAVRTFFDDAAVCDDDDGEYDTEDETGGADTYEFDSCEDESAAACSPSFYRQIDAAESDVDVCIPPTVVFAEPSTPGSGGVDDELLLHAAEEAELVAGGDIDSDDDAVLMLAADDVEFIADAGGDAKPLGGNQLLALSAASDGYSFLLLGSAGTGKSTVVHAIVQYLTTKYQNAARKGPKSARLVAVVAPTGRAASNIGGTTIHSFFRWTPSYDRDGVLQNPDGWMAATSDPVFCFLMCQLGTVIIDEISMLAATHFDGISAMLQLIRGDSRPFGGIQVIGVGDFYQLPPVTTFPSTHPAYAGCPQFVFFSHEFVRTFAEETDSAMSRIEASKRISVYCLRHIQLTVSYRQQTDPAFFALLENMRAGMMTPDDFARLETVTSENDSHVHPDSLRLFARTEPARVYNDACIRGVDGPHILCMGYVYAARLTDKNSIETVSIAVSMPGMPGPSEEYGLCPTTGDLVERFRVPPELEIAVGSRVLVVANQSVTGGVYNGAMGTVVGVMFPGGLWTGANGVEMPLIPEYDHVHPNAVGISVMMDTGRLAVVYRHLFRVPAHVYGSRSIYVYAQFPLVLGYAMTVHKCQGITLSAGVCVNTEHMLNTPGHLYVAFSRCTSFAHLRIITRFLGIRQERLVSRDVAKFYSA